jgi:hypothetical protein
VSPTKIGQSVWVLNSIFAEIVVAELKMYKKDLQKKGACPVEQTPVWERKTWF